MPAARDPPCPTTSLKLDRNQQPEPGRRAFLSVTGARSDFLLRLTHSMCLKGGFSKIQKAPREPPFAPSRPIATLSQRMKPDTQQNQRSRKSLSNRER